MGGSLRVGVVSARRASWLAAALCLAAAGRATAWSADRAVRAPVRYFTQVPPDPGQAALDPAYGTAVWRISDARHRPNAAGTGPLAFIVHEYSTVSPFNQDDSRLLLQHQSYFALYDSAGRYVRDLPFEVAPSSEPRWSRHDPDLLYYVSGNRLKSYDAATGAVGLLHTFSEYSAVSGRGESDLCFDGDHLVLSGDGREVFVYDLALGSKGPVLDTAGHGFDNLHIAPGDQVVVTWYQAGSGRFNGVELFDRDMNFQRQLATVAGHMDVGRDADGQPIVLWMNAADPQPPLSCQNAVVKIRLADAQRTCLLSLDWSLAAHVSAPDGGPWFYVSTFAPSDPDPLQGGWRPYGGELLQVRLDGSEVRRLAHHRSRPFNDYWYTPRAAVDRDGRRLVFGSNYGLPQVLGWPGSYVDTYVIDLAAMSAASVGSEAPLRERFEETAAAVDYAGAWLPSSWFRHSGGSAWRAMDVGARSRFAFTGTGALWISYRDEWAGIARVYLDGELRGSVDTYAAPNDAQAAVFAVNALPPGAHVLEVEATGARNVLSGGSWIWVDAFEAIARQEQDAASLSGAWATVPLGVYSGGSAARSDEPGARASFPFSGTAVSFIGSRDPASGIARVEIDGVPRAEIDTYAPVPAVQAVVYTLSGLAPGAHTLSLEVTGRRHPLSLGGWVWIDGFEVVAP
jgi:hypothetical protein